MSHSFNREQFLRPAVVLSHPGHELLLFGWIAKHKPRVCVLTDGSGMADVPRISASRDILDEMGVTLNQSLALPDKHYYAAIVAQDMAFFCGLVDKLANAFMEQEIDFVAGDARDGHDPTHDLCRAVIDAAISKVRHLTGKRLANYELNVMGWLYPEEKSQDGNCLHWQLDEAMFEKKLAAAKHYRGLAIEISEALAERGEDYFRVERLTRAQENKSPQPEKPFYEWVGEQRLKNGTVSTVIRNKDHVAPIVDWVNRHAAAKSSAPLNI